MLAAVLRGVPQVARGPGPDRSLQRSQCGTGVHHGASFHPGIGFSVAETRAWCAPCAQGGRGRAVARLRSSPSSSARSHAWAARGALHASSQLGCAQRRTQCTFDRLGATTIVLRHGFLACCRPANCTLSFGLLLAALHAAASALSTVFNHLAFSLALSQGLRRLLLQCFKPAFNHVQISCPRHFGTLCAHCRARCGSMLATAVVESVFAPCRAPVQA